MMLERTAAAVTTAAGTGSAGTTRGGRRSTGAATRRRRLTAALLGLTSIAGVATVATGAAAGVAIALLGVTAAYVLAGALTRHRQVRREVARAFAGPGGTFDWAAFAEAGAGGLGDDEQQLVAAAAGRRRGLILFFGASLLGWALTPVVVVARLAAGDRRDLEGDGALARLVALQRHGRAHSMRALAVSLATTAGVGAVGTLAGGLGVATANAAPAPGTYTVAQGDTLATIAAAHGTTVAALVAANDIADPNLIYVGQVLVLAAAPGSIGTPPSAGRPAGSGGTTYVVRAGDTLSAIAAAHGTTVAALVAANHIADPNLIDVGEVLSVPATTVAAPVAPSAAATPAAAPAPVASTAPGGAAAVALRVALEQVGKPYQWGGAGPDSFDCSGLVMYSYAAAGVELPHYSGSQYDVTTRISEAQLEPGDIVFWGGAVPYHEAMYDGNGDIVTADETGTDVRVEPMLYDGTPSGFGRVG